MLTKEQIKEIREHLEKAQNPLFFFDNDNDGLMSFFLLRRYIDRGKGIAIRSFPDLNVSYYRRVKELNPDYIFILDKPLVSKEFFEKARLDNIPVVWIDHHNTKCDSEEVYHYDPYLKGEVSEPVSYLTYKIADKKEDIWLAIIGCISDALIPDFYDEFLKKYPELGKKNPSSAFDVFYNTEIGKIAQILDFSLKDTTTNVVNMLRFMIKAREPIDVLQENQGTKQILKRYNEINSKFEDLMEKARKEVKENLIFFQYGGSLSLSANIANKLSFEFPNKTIVVVYLNAGIANISLRGENIRDLTLKAIEGIEDASGGGHEHATGAKMTVDQLPKFKENVEKLVKN